MYLEVARVLRPMAEQYAKVNANRKEGDDRVRMTVPLSYLRSLYEVWEKLMDEGSLK